MVPIFTCGLVRSNLAANPRDKFNTNRGLWHRDANTVVVLLASRENIVPVRLGYVANESMR